MTTPYYPFDLTLARDCKWPLVTRDGLKAEVLKWDGTGDQPIIGLVQYPTEEDVAENWGAQGWFWINEPGSDNDLFLSSDLTDPLVRAAMQVAHEKLGRAVKFRANFGVEKPWYDRSGQDQVWWLWSGNDYCLTEHLPALVDPIAPGHNPDKLTVSQVGDGYRIVDQDEVMRSMRVRVALPVERWEISCWADDSRIWGMLSSKTYRTQLSREAIAALDEPAWSLPSPPAGKQWHRTDGWTQEMLPEGYRPLMNGEKQQKGDEYLAGQYWSRQVDIGGISGPGQCPRRTRRPLPSSPTFVPWRFESAPISLKVKQKNNGCKAVVYLSYDHYNWSGSPISFDGLFADFTHLDGSPCGMEVK